MMIKIVLSVIFVILSLHHYLIWRNMATLVQLQESLTNIASGVRAVIEKLNTGAPVTQEQLDALEASAQAIEDALAAVVPPQGA